MNRDEKNVSGHLHDADSVSAGDDTGQPVVISPNQNSLPTVRGKDRRRGKSGVIQDAAAALNREQLTSAREDVAHVRENAAGLREENATSREDAAHLREGNATSREQKIRVAETKQEASNDHMLILQQVNERLVITTIEAQQLAEQLQTTQAQLENAKFVAEKASLAKSDFLSSMSHELRTPLNAILGFAQLLEAATPPPTETQNIRLQQIIKAGWYLLELINEILDLAVIESGKLALSLEPVALMDVMHECQSLVEPQAQSHGISLNFLPCDHSWFAHADHTRVKQVLINLLSNAVKYNREHGKVVVACSASSPERIRISVKDSGAGLPAEKLAQLFQPFNRLGQEAGNEEGTGIGLVVSKQLVELMGGSIGVESTVGVGSEFWIELLRDVSSQTAAEHKMAEQHAPQQARRNTRTNAVLRTLLYVEDNPANLMLVEQIIEGQPNLRMLSALDGHSCIALARSHLPDVILMDINLPGINGIEAMKILRENPLTKHIPIIALSANAMLHDINNGLEAGFFRYLTKPIQLNAFMDALEEALKFSETGLDNTIETAPTQTGKIS